MKAPPAKSWYVYILRCANGALYTGIATDVKKRLVVHNAGKGSAYVRAHRPAKLVAFTCVASRSAASILEYEIKALKKSQKLALAKKWKSAAKAA
jgi:putative endonuclease